MQETEYTQYLDIVDLGLQENGDYCLEIQLQPKHLSRAKLVHGGMVFSMLDAAMGRAVIRSLEPGYASPTIEMKINYFRPADRGKLIARGRIVNRSKQLCYAEGEVRNDADKLVARATATFFVKRLERNVNS